MIQFLLVRSMLSTIDLETNRFYALRCYPLPVDYKTYPGRGEKQWIAAWLFAWRRDCLFLVGS